MILPEIRSHIRSLLRVSVVGLSCSPLLCATSSSPAPAPPIDVTIDGSAPPLSSFMGLGVEFDPYQFPPSADRWQTTLDRLAWARLGFLRVMLGAEDYCSGFDASGNPMYVWNQTDSAGQERLQRVLRILDFAQAHHISVYLGEWSPPRALGIRTPDDPRWPRMMADFTQYLVQQKHYDVIGHFIFFNEPNGAWMWPHGAPDYAAWSAGIRRLRTELDRRGLQSVALAGPDNSGDPAWFARSVHDLPSSFGAWESHIYATDAEVLDDTIEANLHHATDVILATDPAGRSKPRFIAESGLQDGKIEALDQQPRVRTFAYGVVMADYIAQIARAGWMGADAWDVDDAMHGNGHGGLKLWGFWDSSLGSDMAIRPWFYTWASISRAFPRGAAILPVSTSPAPDHFRATAANWTDRTGKQFSVLLVNDDDHERSVRVHLEPSAGSNVYVYRYFDSERPAGSNGLPQPALTLQIKPGEPLAVPMPSRGVVLLTTEAP